VIYYVLPYNESCFDLLICVDLCYIFIQLIHFIDIIIMCICMRMFIVVCILKSVQIDQHTTPPAYIAV